MKVGACASRGILVVNGHMLAVVKRWRDVPVKALANVLDTWTYQRTCRSGGDSCPRRITPTPMGLSSVMLLDLDPPVQVTAEL